MYTNFGDNMKAKIKKVVTPIFLSVICGLVCGRVMFSIYEDKGSNILNSNLIYLLEDASYEDYATMKASTITSSYMYYEDEGQYKAVIAMTKNKDNIEKIQNVYDKELKVSEYLLNDETINTKLEEYDIKMKEVTEEEDIKQIIIEMINVYKGLEDVKMVKIS